MAVLFIVQVWVVNRPAIGTFLPGAQLAALEIRLGRETDAGDSLVRDHQHAVGQSDTDGFLGISEQLKKGALLLNRPISQRSRTHRCCGAEPVCLLQVFE